MFHNLVFNVSNSQVECARALRGERVWEANTQKSRQWIKAQYYNNKVRNGRGGAAAATESRPWRGYLPSLTGSRSLDWCTFIASPSASASVASQQPSYQECFASSHPAAPWVCFEQIVSYLRQPGHPGEYSDFFFNFSTHLEKPNKTPRRIPGLRYCGLPSERRLGK